MAGSPLATGLERASLEGAGAVVVLGLNPKSLSIRRNTQWQAPANRSPSAASPASAAVVSPAGPVPVGHGQLQYNRSQPAVLSMVVWFDRSFDADGSIDYEINQLQNWTCPTERVMSGVHSPPRITFIWRSLHFVGVITSLNINFKQFGVDGLPVRAEATISITENPPPVLGTNPTSGGIPAAACTRFPRGTRSIPSRTPSTGARVSGGSSPRRTASTIRCASPREPPCSSRRIHTPVARDDDRRRPHQLAGGRDRRQPPVRRPPHRAHRCCRRQRHPSPRHVHDGLRRPAARPPHRGGGEVGSAVTIKASSVGSTDSDVLIGGEVTALEASYENGMGPHHRPRLRQVAPAASRPPHRDVSERESVRCGANSRDAAPGSTWARSMTRLGASLHLAGEHHRIGSFSRRGRASWASRSAWSRGSSTSAAGRRDRSRRRRFGLARRRAARLWTRPRQLSPADQLIGSGDPDQRSRLGSRQQDRAGRIRRPGRVARRPHR